MYACRCKRANRFWPEINGIDTDGDMWHPHFGDTRGWTNPATPAQYDQYCRDQREAERTRQAALDNPIVPCHGCSSYAGNTSSEDDSSGAPSDDGGGGGIYSCVQVQKTRASLDARRPRLSGPGSPGLRVQSST